MCHRWHYWQLMRRAQLSQYLSRKSPLSILSFQDSILHPYGALLNPARSQCSSNDNQQLKAPGPHHRYADSSTAVCKHRHKLLLRFRRGRDIWHDRPCIYWRSSRRSGDRWCRTWDRPHHRQRLTVLGTPHPLRAAAKGSTVRQSSGFSQKLRVSCRI